MVAAPFLLRQQQHQHHKELKFEQSSARPTPTEREKVYDPAPIVINAAKNAISVAATILTASTIVLLPREDKPIKLPDLQI